MEVNDEMGGEAVLPNNEETLDDEIEEDVTSEEYQNLDAKLDDLNIVLDVIEQKNEQIKTEFLKLLHSNKQIREEMQKEIQNSQDQNTSK